MLFSITCLCTTLFYLGLIDITKDPDFAKIYDQLPMEIPGDAEMAEERRFFMSHVENLSMHMTMSQEEVLFFKNIYLVE